MPAQLVALTEGPSILLDKPILLLGRHPECDIQIDSRKISRRHCCIAQVNDYLIVRDLGSTNGVRINGVRVTEGRLSAGDELTLGNNRYQVSWDSAPASPHPPVPRRRPTVRAPQPPDEIADEDLEACEEPVPLAEPPAAAPRPNKITNRPGSASPPEPSIRSPLDSPLPSPPPQEPEDSLILPDNIELLPNSDAFPGMSGSHPPG